MNSELKDALVQYYMDSALGKNTEIRYLSDDPEIEEKQILIPALRKSEKVTTVNQHVEENTPINVNDQVNLISPAAKTASPKRSRRIYKRSLKRKADPFKNLSKKPLLTKNFDGGFC